MPIRLDKDTLIPAGFFAAALLGVGSGALYIGIVISPLLKLNPTQIEVRLATIEIDVKYLRNIVERREQHRVGLVFPHEPITDKPANSDAGQENSDQKDVLRHYPPPVRILEPLRIDQWGMR
jgi:hypothetical protein